MEDDARSSAEKTVWKARSNLKRSLSEIKLDKDALLKRLVESNPEWAAVKFDEELNKSLGSLLDAAVGAVAEASAVSCKMSHFWACERAQCSFPRFSFFSSFLARSSRGPSVE